jgi:hypothetical protein
MGVFKRHEPSAAEKAMQARFTLGSSDPEPAGETCWFCGEAVDTDDGSATSAALTIEPLGPGEPHRGFCHLACVERAKGSLVF